MWSIIDHGLRDFLRGENGKPLIFAEYEDADRWLVLHGEEYGWTNTGTKFYKWADD